MFISEHLAPDFEVLLVNELTFGGELIIDCTPYCGGVIIQLLLICRGLKFSIYVLVSGAVISSLQNALYLLIYGYNGTSLPQHKAVEVSEVTSKMKLAHCYRISCISSYHTVIPKS